MSLFDRFRRKKRVYLVKDLDSIPLSVISRWFLYDSALGDGIEMAEAIGLSRVSEEGDLKEREDSDYRMMRIAYMLPFIEHMSDLTADTVAFAQAKALEEDGVDLATIRAEMDGVKMVYKAIALGSLMAGFSIANELDMIHLSPGFDNENGDPYEF